MAKAHRMTPARKAALKKAQRASAAKRRGKGKGKLAKANRAQGGRVKRHFNRHGAKYLAGAVLAGYGAATYAGHVQKRQRAKRAADHAEAARRVRYQGMSTSRANYNKKRPKARAHGTGPSRSNRVFVTTRHGTTSVRRKHH